MPKYFDYKVFNHYLYFTSHCIVEAMHVHAGDEEMSEDSSAKFFVKADGSSVMKRRGDLSRKEQVGIQRYIKKHYSMPNGRACPSRAFSSASADRE